MRLPTSLVLMPDERADGHEEQETRVWRVHCWFTKIFIINCQYQADHRRERVSVGPANLVSLSLQGTLSSREIQPKSGQWLSLSDGDLSSLSMMPFDEKGLHLAQKKMHFQDCVFLVTDSSVGLDFGVRFFTQRPDAVLTGTNLKPPCVCHYKTPASDCIPRASEKAPHQP